jgi:succinyl-diaminopimelate desuccinylase
MVSEDAVMGEAEKLQSRLVKLTQELIREESVNPPGNEEGVAQILAEELKSGGAKVRLHEAAPKRVNVEAVLSGSGPRPRFLFNGHMDVVPIGDPAKWTVDPFGGVVRGDRIYGRGAADMKGGLASIAIAMRALHECGITVNGAVVFHAVADEESSSSYGTKHMIRQGLAKADMGLVAEPSVFGDKIAIRHAVRGSCWVKVETFGRAAHGGNPASGINAVLNMCKLLMALDKVKLAHKVHGILPPPTISAGTVIKGGTKTNIIPEYCEAELDVRFVPGMTEQQIMSELRAAAEQIKKEDPRFSSAMEVFEYTPAAEIPESGPVMTAAKRATQQVVGYEPGLAAAYGTTDSAYLIHDAHVPVICGFGPGDQVSGGIHGADEGVSIAQLTDFVKIYALTVMFSLGYDEKS